MSTVDGLVTGLDTTAIIEQLMGVARIPQNQLVARRETAAARASTFAELRGRYDAVRSAAQALDLPDDWALLAATSSDDKVKVSTGSGRITGSATFSVLQRATAHAVYSTDTVSSLDAVITSSEGSFAASGHEALGVSDLAPAGLATGSFAFTVTQASAAAVRTATAPVPAGHRVNGANDTIELEVNGVAHSLQLDRVTYATAEDLRAQIETKLTAAGLGGAIAVRLDGADQLEFVTTREGSDATIRLTGGNALGELGFAVDSVAVAGTDGIVELDGVQTLITNTDPGTQVLVAAATGGVTATLSGGVRTGTAQIANQSYGSRTLAEVVAAINANPALGTRAAIVQVDTGAYRLQLTARETGDDSAIDVDLAEFTGLAGGFTTLTNGQDAVLRVEGVNPYEIRSSSNTFEDLLPGVDVTVTGMPTGTVTVDVTRNAEGLADRVGALVDSVNHVLAGLRKASAYDAGANKASLLTGNGTVRRAADELTAALVGAVAGAGLGTASLTGVALQNDGSLEFDRDAFLAAYEEDPAGVERVYAAAFASGEDSVTSRILAEIEDATAFGTGYLRTAEEAENARVESFDDSIAAWDRRLEIRERVLRATFTRLESVLGELQSQSTWLAGQISSLSAGSAQ